MNSKMLVLSLCSVFMMLSFSSCNQKMIKATEMEEKMLALENFQLIDGTGNQLAKNKVILIKEDKIIKIGDKKDVEIPADCKKINLKGSTLLPGFINAHVHNAYNEENLKNWAKVGVTTVRDLSARSLKDYTQIRDKHNKIPSNAHIVSANPILKPTGGYGWISVDLPEEAMKTVNMLIDNNVDIIKFSLEDNLQGQKWPIFSPDMANAITFAAHARNKKVSVHISRSRNLRAAIDAGVDDISHMVVDDLDDNLIDEIVNKDIYFVPTLELWSNTSKMHNLKWDQTTMENLAKFYKAGGKFAFGTDFEGYTCEFDHGFPITEVTLMQKAGIPNMDIIVSATKNAAFVCGLDKELGTIEEGKKADILVVEGNPLEDINSLTATKLVIHEGHIIVNNGL